MQNLQSFSAFLRCCFLSTSLEAHYLVETKSETIEILQSIYLIGYRARSLVLQLFSAENST